MIIPFVVLAIVFYGISENVDVYDEFVKGARRGLSTVIKIMPTLIGLMTAVGILIYCLQNFQNCVDFFRDWEDVIEKGKKKL